MCANDYFCDRMKGRYALRAIFLLFISLSTFFPLFAQNEVKVEANTSIADSAKAAKAAADSHLVKSYGDHYAYSIFLQQKLIGFHLHASDKNYNMVYRTNHATVLGLGITYRYLTLSASVNLLQTNKEKTVKTKGIDLGTQLNGHRFAAFITSQYFKGFYSRNALLKPSADVFYKREKMSMTLQGLSFYYGLSNRYSFSGNMSRMQYQKRSAGTPMVGIDAFYYLQSDSAALVPAAFHAAFPEHDVMKLRVWSIGPGIGYGHNFVINDRFFLSGMANLKMPINFIKKTNTDQSHSSTVDLGLNLGLWGKISYNRDAWNLSLQYMNNRIPIGKGLLKPSYVNNSGLLRLTYTRRIRIGKQAKKIIKPVDKALDLPLDIMDELN